MLSAVLIIACPALAGILHRWPAVALLACLAYLIALDRKSVV